jgi:hypothetical protein
MKHKSIYFLILILMIAVISVPAGRYAAPARAAAPSVQDATSQQIWNMMLQINANLSEKFYRVDRAEYITMGEAGAIGQTVFFNNRGNKQLASHYVPGDPRRGGRTNITYLIDQTEGAIDNLSVAQTNAAIDRAMTTWNNVNCSIIPITKLPNVSGIDLGVVEFLSGLGGSPSNAADITHAGWLPAGLLPPNVIAVTFTFTFMDAAGNPTDIDNNNKIDTAFSEILYNDAFIWRINGDVDVESIALHESGHALSQGHFGKAFITDSNGKVHFAPRAVMNAAYTGIQQEINSTDNGGHCSNWAKWPNN